MKLTKDEWDHHAAIAAAHKHGENHAGWYQFQRYGMVPTLVLVGAGAVGFIGYKLWHLAKAVLAGANPAAGTPAVFWVVAGILLVVTAVAYRPGRMPSFHPAALIVKGAVFVLAWIGLAAYAVGVIA